jgi:hypothetical protein
VTKPAPKFAEVLERHYREELFLRYLERTPIVYPTVIYDPQLQGLRRLSDRDALNHAQRSGEFIAFPTDREADWFSQNYKLGVGAGTPVAPAATGTPSQ